MILHIGVANKIATFQKRDGCIVCGNDDYKIKFTFDSEWDAYSEKTARFIWNRQYTDVDFTGDTCDVPIINDAADVKVGVYAGELRTTTSAEIGCYRSIRCDNVPPSTENDRNYANEAKEAAERAETAANRAEEAAERAENAGGGGGGEPSAEVLERLARLEDEVYYEAIEFTSFTMVSPSTNRYEIGNSVKGVHLEWGLNKEPQTLKVNNKAIGNHITGYEDRNTTFTSTTSWKVEASDGKTTATKTATLSFLHRVYWGIGKKASGFDSDFVRSLSNSELATSKARSNIKVTPNSDYVYYAVPEDLCKTAEPIFVIDKAGLPGGFESKQVVSVVNSFGKTIKYYVYRSTELLVGATTVDVT